MNDPTHGRPPVNMPSDHAAAASAACAAKSAGWQAVRDLNDNRITWTEARAQMLEAAAAVEEFRATYYPAATHAAAIGDRGIGQRFELYVFHDGNVERVWAEVA